MTFQTFGQVELAKLTALDAAASDNFGNAVAISGSTIIVGAWRESPPTTAGAAYIFEHDGVSWSQQAKIVASDRATGDEFAFSVGISGDWAVVGSWQDVHLSVKTGSAYVYQRVGSSWIQRQKLVAFDRAAFDEFGSAVAIDGSTLIVGADQNFTNTPKAGAAYVYQLINGTWTFQTKLTPPDGAAGDAFGRSLALSGDTVIIGAPNDDPVGFATSYNSGSAYVFRGGGTAWNFEGKLTVSDAVAGDRGALAVAIRGDRAIIGTEFRAGGGAAYVFERSGSSWFEQAKITAADAQSGNGFGNSVAINGDTAVIGSFLDAGGAGSAYVFRFDGSNWSQTAKFLASDGGDLEQFSRSALALSSENIAVIGSVADRHAGIGSGSAYVFDIDASSGEDSDGDGLSDTAESELGTDPFNPDTDGDGVSDGLEVEIAAGSGCPDPLNSDSDGDGLSDGHELDFGPNPCNADVDGDGLADGAEGGYGTDPNNADSDADNVSDGAEITLGTDPLNPDSDGDGLSDGLELAFGTNPLASDSDSDGLTDGEEVAMAAGSGCPNPIVADSDGDGLSDGYESAASLNMCDVDSDHDGLSDNEEAAFGTNPLNSDSDGDGLLDGHEVALAAGSGCPSPSNADSDADGLLDGDELTAGLGPCDSDSDNDGLSDGNEALYGTDPANADTDGDGLLDGTEVDISHGTGCPNPLNPDSDGDGLTDGAEVLTGTNSCSIDTDGDGIPDNTDPAPLSPVLPPQFVADATLAVAEEVQSFSMSVFLGPNDNARKGRQTALGNNLQEASISIRNGHYQAARASLMMVVNKIDGASPPADWMPACPQKAALYDDLQTLLILVEVLQ